MTALLDIILVPISVLGTLIYLWSTCSCIISAMRFKARSILILSLSQLLFASAFALASVHTTYTYTPSLTCTFAGLLILRRFPARYPIQTYFAAFNTTYERVLFLCGKPVHR